MNKSGGLDLGLSLTGMRIGPRDPTTHTAKVGIKNEVVKPDHTLGSLQPRILKERVGFSGGFKIPEEFRKSKKQKLGLGFDHDQEEDLEATQQSHITKDEIFQQLALGNSEAGIGIGRHGTNSKSALAKDLVEGIEKDLEKLRRQQENLQLRKTLALNGGQSIVEETQEEKDKELNARLRGELENAGTYVIDASPKKFQVMRHQASQLQSAKNLNLDELELMRQENDKRLRELEEIYMRKKENTQVGRIMREKMGYSSSSKHASPARKRNNDDQVDLDRYQETILSDDNNLTKSQKKKKSVRIMEDDGGIGEKENVFSKSNNSKYKNDDKSGISTATFPHNKSNSRGRQATTTATKSLGNASRSKSRMKSSDYSPPGGLDYADPRTKLYEAKFEKYLANKEQKLKQDKKLEKMSKEDFDRYTKGPDSPAKSSKRFTQRSGQKLNTAYDPSTLIPENYDETLMVQKQLEEEKRLQSLKKDKFKSLGVSNEDKMTFFLLKWIFNAIKRESSEEDPKLKGRSYVTKIDLIKQLGKNDELMKALGYYDQHEVAQAIKVSGSAKDGCLVWEEFLDFFFLRQASLQKRLDGNDNNWWRQIGNSQVKQQDKYGDNQNSQEDEPHQSPLKSQQQQKQQNGMPRYGGLNDIGAASAFKYEDPDKKPVKMTESLRMLQDTRMQKTAQEVEEEFKILQDKKNQEKLQLQQQKILNNSKKTQSKSKNALYEYDDHDDEERQLEELGIKREKSQCLLLQSQIFIMQEIFEALDKYKDKILRRGQYLMALRTDERVVEFIDIDAVKVPYSNKILTLDEIFSEIEKDEVFELAQIGKNRDQINHKEFITWREFMGYFNDYKEIEERNRKAKEIQRTRQNLQKERQNNATDGSENVIEIMSLMEKEKQRRLQELPKLRPADQIDITEKQLQLLKDIYDSLPRATTGIANSKDMIHTIDFFIATRKNPQLRAIASAIARDPEGYSRIPRETFQQVFDRMENEIQAKVIDWALIVEYFTKRGRPLTKDEIQKLIDDDRRQKEEEENKKRNEEEAERRRLARLMEDLEDKEDFEEFEIRQKSEEAAKILQEKKFERDMYGDEESEGDEDDEAEEYGGRRGRSRQRGHRFMDDSDEEDGRDDHDYEDEEDDIDRDDDEMQGYSSDPELRTAKRSYKFGGGRNQSEKRQRAQSVKPNRNRNTSSQHKSTFDDEKNLRHTKLTTQDYINHERSQSRKKGKYGVTVPKPFDFDVRDKTKKKSIREKKVEQMIAEKKLEEEAIIKHQFRSNPIPPEVLIPRYKTIMEANEMRRLEVKKNSIAITKQTEAPFSFYEREKTKKKLDPEEYLPYDVKKPHFKANPIPRACSVLIFDQMMKRQEEERQERIRKQAELNFSKAKLPDRMQMHQEKMKQEAQNQSRKSLQEQLGYSFKPKINELVTKEQFEKAQQKFNQKLNKKKSQIQVTRPKSPNFTKTSSKTLDRQYLNEQQSQPPVDKFKAALQKSLAKQASMADKQVDNPSSTVSMNLAMQRRREEFEAKKRAEEAKKKEDQERFEKQNRMKNTVQAALKDRIKSDTEKIEEKKRKFREEAREAKKEAALKAQERQNKVQGMPLLIDRLHNGKNNSNLAKIKATQQFLDILKNNGVNPNDHLTEEQKELLAEQEYIDKRKRELGKI